MSFHELQDLVTRGAAYIAEDRHGLPFGLTLERCESGERINFHLVYLLTEGTPSVARLASQIRWGEHGMELDVTTLDPGAHKRRGAGSLLMNTLINTATGRLDPNTVVQVLAAQSSDPRRDCFWNDCGFAVGIIRREGELVLAARGALSALRPRQTDGWLPEMVPDVDSWMHGAIELHEMKRRIRALLPEGSEAARDHVRLARERGPMPPVPERMEFREAGARA